MGQRQPDAASRARQTSAILSAPNSVIGSTRSVFGTVRRLSRLTAHSRSMPSLASS